MHQSRNLPYRRAALAIVLLLGVITAVVLLNLGKNIYADLLWFDSVGYREVYVTVVLTRVWLFFAGAGLFCVLFIGNAGLAWQLSGRGEPHILPPETIVLLRGFTAIGIAITAFIFAIVFGALAASQWENILRFRQAMPFVDGQGSPFVDVLNGRNPSFYVFELPLLRFLQTWAVGIVIVLMAGALSIYAVGYSLRGFHLTFGGGPKAHLAILAGVLACLVAWSYWFDIQELALSSRGLGGTLFGANATDATAKLFALKVMIGVAILVGVVMVVSGFRKGFAWPLAAFAAWAVMAIMALIVYPAAYQRIAIQPNELERETPYIARNIDMTRVAYNLDRIDVQPFPTSEDLPPDKVINNPAVVDNVRVWDHRPLKDTLNQIQFFRPYYSFLDVDVDRYSINGEPRQVMLSARELTPDNLPPEAQNWVARRLQYTHGYGAAMSPVNDFTSEGRPKFFVKDIPPVGNIPVDRPEIYFGEGTRSYTIVNSKTQEFDYPSETAIPHYANYAGVGGVELSSFVRKAAFAWRFADLNLLISDQITPRSRILFERRVQDRVRKIAPFLLLDPDPYLVVADGKLYWIQDAFTTTRQFPYSQPYDKRLNYARNSVKIVMDAYNGAVDFYVADPEDAIIRTYMGIFPELFKPMSAMPPQLRAHVRYPEELFTIQETMFRTYHVTDPRGFFSKEDTWSRPREIVESQPQPMDPYYTIMPLPGGDQAEFLLMVPFTPLNKPNLVAWLAARNDGDSYGKLVAYTFPKDKQVDGPAQVEARIDNDPLISQQFTLWGQQGSHIIRGNLLAIPLGQSILYVEPVYLQSSSLNFPELKRVVVSLGTRSPSMEPSLRRSLDVILGKAQPTLPALGGQVGPSTGGKPGPETTPTPGVTPTPSAPDLDELIAQMQRLLEQMKHLRDEQQGR